MSEHPLSRLLQSCAGIVLVITILATLAIALDHGQLPESIRARAIPAALCLAAGAGLSALILGVMAMLERSSNDASTKRLLGEIRDQFARPPMPLDSSSSGASLSPTPIAGTESAKIIQLLDEIRDISLMTPEQRSERYERLLHTRRQSAAATVDAMIAQGNWTEARVSLRQTVALFGQSPELQAVTDRLNAATIAAEQAAFADLQQNVRELQATDNWDQAIAESESFVRSFPDSAPGLEFHTSLIQARDNHIDMLANGLYDEIRAAVEQRSWRRALGAAQRLLEKCPNHLRAQQAMTQMQLIRDNADTEQRNAMEARIHELVKTGRIRDAIAVIEELIRTYPLSPQAQIASQLALKLHEKLEADQAAANAPSK